MHFFYCVMIRMIDAVKSFDIIFAITQGVRFSIETINLYLTASPSSIRCRYASAIVVVFFALMSRWPCATAAAANHTLERRRGVA